MTIFDSFSRMDSFQGFGGVTRHRGAFERDRENTPPRPQFWRVRKT